LTSGEAASQSRESRGLSTPVFRSKPPNHTHSLNSESESELEYESTFNRYHFVRRAKPPDYASSDSGGGAGAAHSAGVGRRRGRPARRRQRAISLHRPSRHGRLHDVFPHNRVERDDRPRATGLASDHRRRAGDHRAGRGRLSRARGGDAAVGTQPRRVDAAARDWVGLHRPVAAGGDADLHRECDDHVRRRGRLRRGGRRRHRTAGTRWHRRRRHWADDWDFRRDCAVLISIKYSFAHIAFYLRI